MTMNYDMIEAYPRQLARSANWKLFIEAKYRLMQYWRESKQVNHQTRRAFIEILCIQIFTEDLYNLEETCQKFCREFGGNPYEHDEYSVMVDLKEAIEKKDWESATEVTRKPIFGFLEIEVVRPLRKWLSEQKPVQQVIMEGANEQEALDEMLC